MGAEGVVISRNKSAEHGKMLRRKQDYIRQLNQVMQHLERKYAEAKNSGASDEVLSALRVEKKNGNHYTRFLQRKINRNDPYKRVMRIDQNI